MKRDNEPEMVIETRRRKSLGRAGESVAREFLEKQGFRVIQTNFRRRSGEIDIIATLDILLVFCEVKTSVGSGNPVEGYSVTQQRRMVELSETFIAENTDVLPKGFDLRYDLIVVSAGDDGVLEVTEHITDAFRP